MFRRKSNKFEVGDLVRFVGGKPGIGIILEVSDRSLDKSQAVWVYYVHYATGMLRWEMEYGLHKIAAA